MSQISTYPDGTVIQHYNSPTAENYERAEVYWSGTEFILRTAATGTGVRGTMNLGASVVKANNLQVEVKGHTHVAADVVGAESTANKGQASGYASLDASKRLPAEQLPLTAVEYKGTWNAATNTPTLANGTGNMGDIYRVTTGGTQLGVTVGVGDVVFYDGATWHKLGAGSSGGGSYTLPVATATVLGGVKQGSGVTIAADGTLSASGGGSYTLPPATATVLGGVKVGAGLTVDGTGLLAATATNYTLPVATATVLGGVKAGAGVSIAADGTLTSTDAVSSVAGRTGAVVLTKADVGLPLADNTADVTKNVLSATKLTTARTINGVAFDGTANITVPVSTADAALFEKVANKGIANGYASLGADGKLPSSQLSVSALEYKGTWNAATNTPPLAAGVGTPGDMWRVTVTGTQFGVKFTAGDFALFNGTSWETATSGTAGVSAVAGLTGDVAAAPLKTALVLDQVDNTRDNAKAVLSATKLTTARTINGVAFDGTANITVPPSINPLTAKTTPVDADELPIADSAATFTTKKLTWANLKATLGVWYDTAVRTLTNKTLLDPRIDRVLADDGQYMLRFFANPGTVTNYLGMSNAVAGASPALIAAGTDANIGMELRTAGTGVLTVNNVPVVTTNNTVTMTNKTLTSPKIGNALFDTNGVAVLLFPLTARDGVEPYDEVAAPILEPNEGAGTLEGRVAANYFVMRNAVAGSTPMLGVTGADTTLGLDIYARGNGTVTLKSGSGNNPLAEFKITTNLTSVNYLSFMTADATLSPTISAVGTDPNIGINLVPKGTGTINANGSPVVTAANRWAAVPASATAAGTAGQTAYDANFMYVCITTGAAGAAAWKRTPLTTW